MKVLMLHGVNHNMFGKRDPQQYGTITLDEINAKLQKLGKELGADVECYQTNHEGDMCERIHQAFVDKTDAVPFAMLWLCSLALWWSCTCPTSTPEKNSATHRCWLKSSKVRSAALDLTAICWPCAQACQRRKRLNERL